MDPARDSVHMLQILTVSFSYVTTNWVHKCTIMRRYIILQVNGNVKQGHVCGGGTDMDLEASLGSFTLKVFDHKFLSSSGFVVGECGGSGGFGESVSVTGEKGAFSLGARCGRRLLCHLHIQPCALRALLKPQLLLDVLRGGRAGRRGIARGFGRRRDGFSVLLPVGAVNLPLPTRSEAAVAVHIRSCHSGLLAWRWGIRGR